MQATKTRPATKTTQPRNEPQARHSPMALSVGLGFAQGVCAKVFLSNWVNPQNSFRFSGSHKAHVLDLDKSRSFSNHFQLRMQTSSQDLFKLLHFAKQQCNGASDSLSECKVWAVVWFIDGHNPPINAPSQSMRQAMRQAVFQVTN